jgi:hypothetical protein
MEKYHKEVFFPSCFIGEAKGLIADLKYRKLSFSFHALQELGKESEAVLIGQALKDYSLNFDDIFEIAIDKGIINKLGFRVKFSENDIIFILNREKNIVTLWTNNKNDCHYTLNNTKYCTV